MDESVEHKPVVSTCIVHCWNLDVLHPLSIFTRRFGAHLPDQEACIDFKGASEVYSRIAFPR